MNGDRFKTGEREKKNRFRLEELKAPVVLPAGEDLSFSGVSASFQVRMASSGRSPEEERGEGFPGNRQQGPDLLDEGGAGGRREAGR